MRHGGITALARAHGLAVIEDCAHAIEATIDGRHCGTFGDFGCFSFYVTKNITTVEGGMVTCPEPGARRPHRDPGAARHDEGRLAIAIATTAIVHYDVHEPGFKHNLTDLAASLGSASTRPHREELGSVAGSLWAYYLEALRDLPLILPAAPPPTSATRSTCSPAWSTTGRRG